MKAMTFSDFLHSCFSRFQFLIKYRAETQPSSQRHIGDMREEKIFGILQKMKDDNSIRDFLPTGKLSFADVMYGVDFYVTVICESSHRFIELSITGPKWVEKHKQKRPNTLVIGVESYETDDIIRKRIEGEIKEFLCYH